MRLRAGKPPGQDDDGLWVLEPLSGGWVAWGRMVPQGGRLVIAELRIVAAPGRATPPGGISQAVVRRVPYGRFGPFVLALASFSKTSGIGGLREHFAATVGARLGKLSTTRPRQRRAVGRDDRYYALIARDYLDAIRESRTPIKDLAAARRESTSRIRDQVREARERGLLSMSEPGRLGGELLPRAHELLKKGDH